ncbi:MAG: AmmeMemoRadiSam system protein B [Clostridia bacterium]|nr:AmmeMemoRadiSam system protein B [Clostridia bacterium]
MKRTVFISLAFIITTALLSYRVPVQSVKKGFVPAETMDCRYYNETEFMASVNKAAGHDINAGRVYGGVVPHHLLAADLIAGFFKTISAQKPELVIIMGPNHLRLGQGPINTCEADWNTPFGLLKADKETVRRIMTQTGAHLNNRLLKEDHAVAALIPYIKYYLPQAEVVPILISGSLGKDASGKLGQAIVKASGSKNAIYISSIDFSHYLPMEKAEKMDKITLEAVKSRDIDAISRMGNDNLDSPPSMLALLAAMEKVEALDLILLEHSNSAKISGQGADNTTSYFTMIFTKSQLVH